MYSELEDIEKTIYLNILKKSNDYRKQLEFEIFNVYQNKTSILKIKKSLTNFIQNTQYDKISRILPILVTSKSVKVDLFDLIKDEIQQGRLVYVPNPPASVSIFNHLYNCFIEEFGLNFLEEISKKIQTHPKRNQCEKAFIHLHNEKKKDLVIRWFLGEELSIQDKETLGFKNEIDTDENSFEMIKIIGNYSDKVILLYIDDIELPYEKYGESAEIKFLESLKRVHHDVKQLVIILICLKESWPKILKLADESFRSILGPEIEFYDLVQLKGLITKTMDNYWLKNGIKPPINQYFPLNEKLINTFFKKTEGDIKNFLKLCIETIDKIIASE
jgi:hypothetical protein